MKTMNGLLGLSRIPRPQLSLVVRDLPCRSTAQPFVQQQLQQRQAMVVRSDGRRRRGSTSSIRIGTLHPRNGDDHATLSATDYVKQFWRNAKAKAIDPRIFHQQIPNLLLALIDDPSNDSGPMVNLLLDYVRAAKLNLSVKVYSMAIEAWLASRHEDSLQEAYQLLQEFLEHDATVPRNHVEEEDEANRINNAFAIVNHALLERYNHNHEIHKHSSVQYLNKAELLEQQMLAWYTNGTHRQPNTNSMNARISLMSAKARVADALALLNTMIEAEDKGDISLAPNQTSYNTMLYGCAKVGNDELARDTLHRMISRNQRNRSCVAPNVASFNGLLNAYSNNGRADAGNQAERILDWMEELDQTDGFHVQPDERSYAIVMDAYSKSKSPARAESVFHRLLKRQREGHNLAPTVFTFNSMLNAISKTGADDSIEKAEGILAIMEELHKNGLDVAPTTGTYNCLLNVWKAFRDRPDAATASLRILEQMKSKSTWARPNRKTYNTVLYTLTSPKGDHIDLAEDLIEEMNSSDDPALKPDSITYNTILNFLANQKSDSARTKGGEIFSLMMERKKAGELNVAPTIETYNTMMKIAASTGTLAGVYRAESLLDELENLYQNGDPHLRPNTISYTVCLSAWARVISDDDDDDERIARGNLLMDRMKRSYAAGNVNARPTTGVYNALLSCYKGAIEHGIDYHNQGDIILSILRLLEEMRQSDYAKPLESTYVTVMKALNFLPRRDERVFGYMTKVFEMCREDRQVGTHITRLLEKVHPTLLDTGKS